MALPGVRQRNRACSWSSICLFICMNGSVINPTGFCSFIMKETLYDHFKDHLLWVWDHLPARLPGPRDPEGRKHAVQSPAHLTLPWWIMQSEDIISLPLNLWLWKSQSLCTPFGYFSPLWGNAISELRTTFGVLKLRLSALGNLFLSAFSPPHLIPYWALKNISWVPRKGIFVELSAPCD